MNENKFTTYLLYAIGEILLVVVGILIAISIDEWNSEQNSQIENKKLLRELVFNLEKDTSRFSSIMYDDFGGYVGLEKAVKNCARAIRLTYVDLTPQLADSLLSVSVISTSTSVNTETSTYDQLKSTGKLYSLTSDSLKSKIIDYYSTAQQYKESMIRGTTLLQQYQFNASYLLSLYTDFSFNQHVDIRDHNWLFNKNSSEMEAYRVLLFKTMGSQSSRLDLFTSLRNQATLLIEEINRELDNK